MGVGIMSMSMIDYLEFNKKFTRYYQNKNIIWCNGEQKPFIFENENEAKRMLEHLRGIELIQLNLHTLSLFCSKGMVSLDDYFYYLRFIFRDGL